MGRKAKSLLDGCADKSYTSTLIGKANAYLAQLYINRYQKTKRKQFWTTRTAQPCRPERYIRRDQQSESLHATAVYQQRGILTAISKAKAYLAQLCISSDQRSNPCNQQRDITCGAAVY